MKIELTDKELALIHEDLMCLYDLICLSANRKARYTMIQFKGLRQVRDKLEKLLKEASEKK